MRSFLRNRKRLVKVGGITVAVLIFGMTTAIAAFKIQASDGSTTVTIADNAAGDSDGLLGSINWTGDVGIWHVTVQAAQSKPILGSANSPELDMTVSATARNAGALTNLTLMATDTGFTGGGGGLDASTGGTLSTGVYTVKFDAYTDSSNAEFGTGGVHSALGTASTSPFALANQTNGVITTPFSMTNVAFVTATAKTGNFSFDFDAKVVPEGSSLAMLLPGLLPLGLVLRKRMKKA